MIADGVQNPTKQISALSFTDTEDSGSDKHSALQHPNESVEEYYVTKQRKSSSPANLI